MVVHAYAGTDSRRRCPVRASRPVPGAGRRPGDPAGVRLGFVRRPCRRPASRPVVERQASLSRVVRRGCGRATGDPAIERQASLTIDRKRPCRRVAGDPVVDHKASLSSNLRLALRARLTSPLREAGPLEGGALRARDSRPRSNAEHPLSKDARRGFRECYRNGQSMAPSGVSTPSFHWTPVQEPSEPNAPKRVRFRRGS